MERLRIAQESDVRGYVISLQGKGLPTPEQLAELLSLQLQLANHLSPSANEYLNRQIEALTEFTL